MVLILRTDASDPITSLCLAGDSVVIGTAFGSVKLVFNHPENEKLRSVTLAKRSTEAATHLYIEDDNVFALFGDSGIKRWNLRTLQYEANLVSGCRHDPIALALTHVVGHCSTAATFISPRTVEQGPRVAVVRINGECGLSDLDCGTQRAMENVGPVPESDCLLRCCAFDGERIIWASRRIDGEMNLRLWAVWSSPAEIKTKQIWRSRANNLGGVSFIDEETIMYLQNSNLFIWHVNRDSIYALRASPSMKCFSLVRTADGFCGLLSLSLNGTLKLGELKKGEGGKLSYRKLESIRPQHSKARLILNLPYVIEHSIQDGSISVVYNDDFGVHIERDLFRLL